MKHKSGLVRNCGVLKRCMSILLALAMVVTLMPTPQAKAEAETRAAATTKIHFRDESKAYWGAPRFWAWTDDGDYISSGWDGRPTMQPEGDGWYVYESSVPVGSNMGVLFTNPDDSKQKTDRIELKKVGNTNTKPVIGLEVRVENSNVTIVNPGTEVEVAEPEKRESPVISGKQVNFNYYAPYAGTVDVRGSFNGLSDATNAEGRRRLVDACRSAYLRRRFLRIQIC